MWFTEEEGCAAGSCPGEIGRITTAGIITDYPLPDIDSFPEGITVGPDSAMWFTNTSNIGRITTAGAITEYPLTTISGPQGITTGSDGSLWFTGGVAGQIIAGKVPGAIGQITTAGAVTTYPIPFTNVVPQAQGIAAGTGTIWFTDSGTNAIGTFAPAAALNPLVAAVLPESRSVEVGATATAFATIINAGTTTASACSIASENTSSPASFLYQTTNPTTNALIGTVNTPVNIPQGASQSFVIAFALSGAFGPTDVAFNFTCTNAATASVFPGINTLSLSASATPVPDIVALAASGDPGYVDIPGATGTGDFAVATINLGSTATITAAANTGGVNLTVTLTLCETNPSSGACLATPTPTVTTSIAATAAPTFGIFVTGSGTVADSPGTNRVFVAFTDSGGVLRGETSVAVRTQPTASPPDSPLAAASNTVAATIPVGNGPAALGSFIGPASFAPQDFTLSVSTVGRGIVGSAPAGIDCGVIGHAVGKKCSASFPAGIKVTLAATPDHGWKFDEWRGPCHDRTKHGKEHGCVVTMDAAESAIVKFKEK
jgi:hypothetical protein